MFYFCFKGQYIFFITYLLTYKFQTKQQMSNMEFGRRLATERDLEKTEVFNLCNIGEHVYSVILPLFCVEEIHLFLAWVFVT